MTDAASSVGSSRPKTFYGHTVRQGSDVYVYDLTYSVPIESHGLLWKACANKFGKRRKSKESSTGDVDSETEPTARSSSSSQQPAGHASQPDYEAHAANAGPGNPGEHVTSSTPEPGTVPSLGGGIAENKPNKLSDSELSVHSGGCRQNKRRKVVLNKVTCMFPSGQVCAVMGPSGCGKSTLLDLLAGQVQTTSSSLQGCVYVGGRPRTKRFGKECAYVQQDDIVMGTLTVEENLMFSANLRIRGRLTAAQKKERVGWVLNELGLERVAKSKVGTAFIRGVSGGERKRVSIGMELVTDPALVLLDEPTSGLDASTALQLIILLKHMARNGRTIITSIHQPRYNIFKLFDRLLLLSAGNVVYEGLASESVDYFASIGYECERLNNPADFFLDLIQSESSTRLASQTGDLLEAAPLETLPHAAAHELKKSKDVIASDAGLPGYGSALEVGGNATAPNGSVAVTVDSDTVTIPLDASDVSGPRAPTLAEHYRRSERHRDVKAKIAAAVEAGEQGRVDPNEPRNEAFSKFAQPFYVQSLRVLQRSVLNDARDLTMALSMYMMQLVLALLMGTVFYQLGNTPAEIQNIVGALFFAVVVAVFTHMNASFPLIQEFHLFRHERSRGYYRTEAYFVAKIIADLAILRVLPLVMFCCISYWMVGLDADMGKFLLYTLTIVITTVASTSVAFCTSYIVPVDIIASLLCILIYSVMMVFGGMLANVSTLPVALRWVQWLSFFRYAFEVLTTNELEGKPFQCTVPNSADSGATNTTVTCFAGNEYLKSQNFSSSNTVFNLGMLILFTVVYYSLALLRLKFAHKRRQ